MATAIYLAMTASEFAQQTSFSADVAWLDCHFSLYGTGLTDLPSSLPVGSLLMINDRIPFRKHDPARITDQILPLIEMLECSGVVLDFQQPFTESLQHLAVHLCDVLPCPVAVTEAYAAATDSPVFLSPCPHHVHLSDHLAPWKNREIWLDLAVDAQTVTLTADGAAISPLTLEKYPPSGHWDVHLHCHYCIETGDDFARFTIWRTKDDADALAKDAEELGVKTFIGLWQELM